MASASIDAATDALLAALPQPVLAALQHAHAAWSLVPGSSVVARYIRNSYRNDPARVVLELLLFFYALKYLLAKRQDPAKSRHGDVKLTEREIDELVDEWQPEPLVPGDADADAARADEDELNSVPVIVSAGGTRVKVEGSNKQFLNFTSFDVYGLANSERVKDKAVLALRKYGVGACNPPGFYGTMDVHMQLEKDIAAFLGADHAILYAQGFSAIASVVPAFSKRGDLVVVDEGVSFALQKGFQISRSKVVTFKHNDMRDLERKLMDIAAEDKRLKRPLYRKFILVEGIYANSGDICPLPELVALKEKYKYRLIVEESCSFGVLGAKGRGVTDHFSIPATKVDMIVGSLATAIGSSGGFCAGALPVIEHQRLSASAYVFSAALPPMLAVAASEGLHYIERDGAAQLAKVRDLVKVLRDALKQVPYFELVSDPESPLQHVRLAADQLPMALLSESGEFLGGAEDGASGAPASPQRSGVLFLLAGSGRARTNSRASNSNLAASTRLSSSASKDPDMAKYEAESRLLQDIVRECFEQGVIVSRAKYNAEQEVAVPRASLKFIVQADLQKRDVEQAGKVVRAAAAKVVQSWAKARRN